MAAWRKIFGPKVCYDRKPCLLVKSSLKPFRRTLKEIVVFSFLDVLEKIKRRRSSKARDSAEEPMDTSEESVIVAMSNER